MCDPLTAIMGIVSIGAAFMQYQQQQAVMNMQNQANNDWVAWQRQKAREEDARQDQMRQRAEAARQEALLQHKPEDQAKAQGEEEQRVKDVITPKDMVDENPELIGDKLLSGQKGGDVGVQQNIAEQVTNASRDARARIAALATLQSYGPSSFSLANRSNNIFQTGANQIQLIGDERQGSLGAYGAEKQVQPRQIQATPSIWGGLASGLASIAGKSFGGGGGRFGF